ncbi:MAG: hypothetical protein U0Z70_14230 [Thermomicrobiales bacterium]
MEASKLEQLLRKAARQVSRRETLGALVGSALLLNDRGQLEATQKGGTAHSSASPAARTRATTSSSGAPCRRLPQG